MLFENQSLFAKHTRPASSYAFGDFLMLSVLSLFLALSAGPSHAWNPFGSANYEECVVDKMKGQDRSMTWRVQDACEIKFPYEHEVDLRDADNFRWTWELRPNNQVALLLATNETVYAITRAKLLLFEGECNTTPAPNAKSAHADLVAPRFGSEFVAPLSSPGTYRCAVAKFWGKRRR